MFAVAKGKQQVRKSVLIISHTTFRDCRVLFFCDNLSRNSRISAPTWRTETDRNICYRVLVQKREFILRTEELINIKVILFACAALDIFLVHMLYL